MRRINIPARFVLSFMAMVILTLSLGSIVYVVSIRSLKTSVNERNLSILETSGDILDRHLLEITLLMTKMAASPTMTALFALEGDLAAERNPLTVWRVSDRVAHDYYKEGIVSTLWIFQAALDLVITPDNTFTDLAHGYGDQQLRVTGMTYTAWRSWMLVDRPEPKLLPSVEVQVEAARYRALPYVRSFPSRAGRAPKGALVVFIGEQAVHDLFQPLELGDEGWFYVIDPEGRVISRSVGEKAEFHEIHGIPPTARGWIELESDRDILTVSYVRSVRTGLTYVAVIPKDTLLRQVRYIRIMTIVTVAIILLVALGVSFLMGRSYSEPIVSLLGLIDQRLRSGETRSWKAFRNLGKQVEREFDRVDDLRSDVATQTAVLTDSFLIMLLNGDLGTREEIDRILAHTNIQVKGMRFAVLLIRPLGFGQIPTVEDQRLRERVLSLIRGWNVRNKLGAVHQINSQNIAVLLELYRADEGGFRQRIETAIESLRSDAETSLGMELSCTVGSLKDSLLDVHASLSEASLVADHNAWMTNGSITWVDDLPNTKAAFFYPLEYERRLLNLVKSGQAEEALRSLGELIRLNMEERQLRPRMLNWLLVELRCTVLRALGEIDLSPELAHEVEQLISLRRRQVPHAAIESISRAMGVIAAQTKNRVDNYGVLVDQAVSEISYHYDQCDFDLAALADSLGVSQAHLSRTFKARVGQTFHDYLNMRRMEKARELLAQTDTAIKEVAEQVGLWSARGFRRAFSKYAGVSPSAYRRLDR